MQRELLMKHLGRKLTFVATFIRYSTSKDGRVTMLFRNLQLNNELLTDHIWIMEDTGFQVIKLDAFDNVEFTAQVCCYRHIYDIDAQLCNISNPKVISKNNYVKRCGGNSTISNKKNHRYSNILEIPPVNN